MAILNRVINILILLAAIAAVVFSYLLFNKREQVVKGWAQMATAINTAARTLDDGGASGTTAAKDLPEDKLKHENYEQLGSVLPKLKENAGKIVAQRNELADTMQKAAKELSITGVESRNLKSVASYKDQERIFGRGVQQFRSNRDAVAREYSQTFSRFGASVSAADLKDPKKFSSAIKKGNDIADDTVKRKKTYASFLKKIVAAMQVQAPNVDSPAYSAELNTALERVEKKNTELELTKRQLNAGKNEIARLKRQIDGHRKTISARDQLVQQKEKEIKNLTNILNKDGSLKLPEKLLTSSDPECYKYVRGTVEYVDKDYGFIQINIGSHYSFVQHYGIKENRVLFPLQAGKVMTVVRNLGTDKPLFIGKILVTKVDEKSSVCNLIGGHPELYQEGDSVLFTDEDIAKALSGKKAAAGK